MAEAKIVEKTPDHILTPEEVQKEFKIKAKTLACWRSRKIGPRYIKPGRNVLYRRKDIERFLDRCQYMTTESL